jgi:hypothetical protein
MSDPREDFMDCVAKTPEKHFQRMTLDVRGGQPEMRRIRELLRQAMLGSPTTAKPPLIEALKVINTYLGE